MRVISSRFRILIDRTRPLAEHELRRQEMKRPARLAGRLVRSSEEYDLHLQGLRRGVAGIGACSRQGGGFSPKVLKALRWK